MSEEDKNKQNNNGSDSGRPGKEKNCFDKDIIGDSKEKIEELRKASEIPPRTPKPKPKNDSKD
jgi:hypothetical protein